MKRTHATNRPRASSDPGSLATGQEDMELQLMGTRVEVSRRAANDNTAAPNQPEILAAPSIESLQTLTILHSVAPSSITMATTPRQNLSDLASNGISRSVQLEHRGQPFTEEAARPGQEETPAGATLRMHSTVDLHQSDIHVHAQENDLPRLEDIIEIAAEILPTTPVTESSMSHAGHHTEHGQETQQELLQKFHRSARLHSTNPVLPHRRELRPISMVSLKNSRA
jgi:hypothetical protein